MAAEKKTATPPTRYAILRQTETGDWALINEGVLANGAEQAIRANALMLEPSHQGGTYVAVAQRSWQPKKIAVSTQIRLELTEAKP